MSVTLFPSIQPQSVTTQAELGLYKEIAWDFENNTPIFKNGSPLIVTGKEAVMVWAWKALHTPRFRYEIFTWDFGNEVESLIGQPFTEELKRSEAARFVKDCLIINPYITGVSDVVVAFSDDRVTISCRLATVYGEEKLNV